MKRTTSEIESIDEQIIYEEEMLQFPEIMTPEERIAIIKSTLININCADAPTELNDPNVWLRLKVIGRQIDKLGATMPHDRDVSILKILFQDLEEDFRKREALNLDSGFEAAIRHIGNEVAKMGVSIQAPGKGALKELICLLSSAGISLSYVVSQANPEQAATLLCFLQSHPNHGMTADFMSRRGIAASQQQILDVLKQGLLTKIYTEGWPNGRPLTVGDANWLAETFPALASAAATRVKREIGDEIEIIGIEEWLLHQQIERNWGNLEILPGLLKHRTTGHNILLASNLEKLMREKLAGVLIGFGHEKSFAGGKNILGEPEAYHQLPFSTVLAYYGFNVVVVDMAGKTDTDSLIKAL